MASKLRFHPLEIPFPIVLVDPEIPPNTGNVARLCVAVGSPLHLVGKLGFDLSEKAVRRAGLDYWPLVRLSTHENLDVCLASIASPHAPLLFTSNCGRSYLDAPYAPGTPLVFGREATGLDTDLLEAFPDRAYAIPTCGPLRSLNLANAVSIVVYEALRKTGRLENVFEEV